MAGASTVVVGFKGVLCLGFAQVFESALNRIHRIVSRRFELDRIGGAVSFVGLSQGGKLGHQKSCNREWGCSSEFSKKHGTFFLSISPCRQGVFFRLNSRIRAREFTARFEFRV